MKIGDLVAVVWEDAWVDVAEHTEQDWKDEAVYTTFGLVVGLTEKLVRVTQDVFEDGGTYRCVTHIPLSLIVSVTTYAPDGQRAEVS